MQRRILWLMAFCTTTVCFLPPTKADIFVSDTNTLGQLSIGDMGNLVGDTDGEENIVNYYFDVDESLYWSREFVYEFSLTETSKITFELISNSSGTDRLDLFVLGGLSTVATTVNVGGQDVNKTKAAEAIQPIFLDDGVPEFAILESGTYYLSVTNYDGTAASIPASTTDFSLNYNVEAITPSPTTFHDLGQIAIDGEAFVLDTIGSGITDTEIGIYNDIGVLIEANDDITTTDRQSKVDFQEGLPVGTYYIAAGEWDVDLGDGFLAEDVTPGAVGGSITLNHPLGAEVVTIPGDGVDWFQFTIGVDTFASADVDGDGDVDGSDFLLIQTGFGTTYDAQIFEYWRQNFGSTANASKGLGSGASVPEPSTLMLLAFCLVTSFAIRRKQLPKQL